MTDLRPTPAAAPVRVVHVDVAVARPAADVAAFVADPANLPRWAAGLAGADVRRDGDHWVTDSPAGPVRIAFVAPNALGVCDHLVTTPDGARTLNPLRVLDDGPRCDVVFTLRQRPGVSDEAFRQDVDAVRADLARLRDLLER